MARAGIPPRGASHGRARPSCSPARYWIDVIAEAERGLLDFVTIEDGFSLPSSRTDRVGGRLDAVLIAARAAPLTRHIGLMPTVVVTHTEPFHTSKAIATLDYASNGRAGAGYLCWSQLMYCRASPPES
jgi:alkanesulfonate monooxygenase SsuD/methylene tetrahydromethanopterin reductase-like flavin-dependent oxidoreductase (luciferase family)